MNFIISLFQAHNTIQIINLSKQDDKITQEISTVGFYVK
jgi:hypothetical protein